MKHPLLPFLVLLGFGIAASCSRDSPTEAPLQAPDVGPETAAGKPVPALKFNGSALSVEDMLGDPLFQALVHAIEEPALSEPVLAAVDALGKGQTKRATNLIARATAVADALEAEQHSEELILWAVLLRFFEEAELT